MGDLGDGSGSQVPGSGGGLPAAAKVGVVRFRPKGKGAVQPARHVSARRRRDVNQEEAGQRNQRGLPRARADRQDEHRVGEVRVVAARATTGHQQDIDALVMSDPCCQGIVHIDWATEADQVAQARPWRDVVDAGPQTGGADDQDRQDADRDHRGGSTQLRHYASLGTVPPGIRRPLCAGKH